MVLGWLQLIIYEDHGHLTELRCELGGLFGELEGIFVFIELRQHRAQLQDKATMVSSHVYGTLEGLSRRPSLGARVFVAVEPCLTSDLFLFLLQFCVSLIQILPPTSSWSWLSA